MEDNFTENILEKALREANESCIEIKTKMSKNPDGSVSIFVKDPDFPILDGCCSYGTSEEEAIKTLRKLIKVTCMYYEEDSLNYMKRAIWRSHKGDRTFWFTIIGIGLNFYLANKNFKFHYPSENKKLGFWIGRLRIDFINKWKIKKNI